MVCFWSIDIDHLICESYGPLCKKNSDSPVENKNDPELDFKVFFFMDSCCSDIVHDKSN